MSNIFHFSWMLLIKELCGLQVKSSSIKKGFPCVCQVDRGKGWQLQCCQDWAAFVRALALLSSSGMSLPGFHLRACVSLWPLTWKSRGFSLSFRGFYMCSLVLHLTPCLHIPRRQRRVAGRPHCSSRALCSSHLKATADVSHWSEAPQPYSQLQKFGVCVLGKNKYAFRAPEVRILLPTP